MPGPQTVTFYLPPEERRKAERGNHNFIARMAQVLTAAGYQIELDSADAKARARAKSKPGRSLFLMQEPVTNRGLTFRKTYIYPFWHIEAQAKRWAWPVAQTPFRPELVDQRKAKNFHRFWRNRLFGPAGHPQQTDGFVLIPLQERLLQQRSFQFCSPIDMVRAVLAQDRNRVVLMTLHPGGTYTDAETAALDALVAQHDRLFLRQGGSEAELPRCDYVVTQNSGVGLLGYFLAKPLILFGQSDFHHAALNVQDIGVKAAFDRVMDHPVDYGGFLYWFLQDQAINAGRPQANDRIAEVFRHHGWMS